MTILQWLICLNIGLALAAIGIHWVKGDVDKRTMIAQVNAVIAWLIALMLTIGK